MTSAFAGILPFSPHWRPPRGAGDRVQSALSVRCAREPQWIQDAGLWLCSRGPEGHAHDDGELAVVVDGYLWIDGGNGAERELLASRPAEAIADRVRAGGFDWVGAADGSFSIAVIDRRRARVHLIRDRFGSRPLYYANTPHGWAWGSRIAALLPTLPDAAVDLQALSEVAHYRWLIGDRTLVRGVRQVLPAFCIDVGADHHEKWTRHFDLEWRRSENTSVSAWADRIDEALNLFFDRATRRFDRLAVLADGSHRSAVLAAIAARHTDRVSLISVHWKGLSNLHLRRAREWARVFAMDLDVVEVDESRLADLGRDLCHRLEEPFRDGRALAHAALIESLGDASLLVPLGSEELLGARAMSFFRGFLRRAELLSSVPIGVRRAARELIPPRRLGMLGSIRRALSPDFQNYVYGVDALASALPPQEIVPSASERPIPNPLHISRFLRPHAGTPPDYCQAHLLGARTVAAAHTLGRLAGASEPLMPYLSAGVVDAALAMPRQLQTGADGPAPVARELARRYLPEAWLEHDGGDFEGALRVWVGGALRGHVESLRSVRGIDGARLADAPVADNHQLQLTLLALVWTLGGLGLELGA